LKLRRELVAVDEYSCIQVSYTSLLKARKRVCTRPGSKEAVDVFQRSIRRFGIKEIRYRDEAETNDCPNDPKAPAYI